MKSKVIIGFFSVLFSVLTVFAGEGNGKEAKKAKIPVPNPKGNRVPGTRVYIKSNPPGMYLNIKCVFPKNVTCLYTKFSDDTDTGNDEGGTGTCYTTEPVILPMTLESTITYIGVEEGSGLTFYEVSSITVESCEDEEVTFRVVPDFTE